MVPITPCNVPPAGIVGVLMRMEERYKALKEEVGRIVTHKVTAEITDNLVNFVCTYVIDDMREVTYIDLFYFIICLANSKETNRMSASLQNSITSPPPWQICSSLQSRW